MISNTLEQLPVIQSSSSGRQKIVFITNEYHCLVEENPLNCCKVIQTCLCRNKLDNCEQYGNKDTGIYIIIRFSTRSHQVNDRASKLLRKLEYAFELTAES